MDVKLASRTAASTTSAGVVTWSIFIGPSVRDQPAGARLSLGARPGAVEPDDVDEEWTRR
jgi:hypothetical protein